MTNCKLLDLDPHKTWLICRQHMIYRISLLLDLYSPNRPNSQVKPIWTLLGPYLDCL